jgi:hypothetical protein
MRNGLGSWDFMKDDYDFNALLHPSDFVPAPGQADENGTQGRPNKILTEYDFLNATQTVKSAAESVGKYFRQKITITENGKTPRVTIFEAIILVLYGKAINGDQRALAALIRYSKFGRGRSEGKRGVIAVYEMEDGIYIQENRGYDEL